MTTETQLNLEHPPIWYIPSFYGDISLTTVGKATTEVTWENLTKAEQTALESLVQYAQDKKWKMTGPDGNHLLEGQMPVFVAKDGSAGPYRDHPGTGSLTIHKRLATIKNRLARRLKPGRELVDVVQFSSGKIVEHKTVEHPDKITPPAPKPKRGVTVAAPTVGCDVPKLARAEIKAREVLMAFLDEEQKADFTAHNRFMSRGAATGHRYIITSRHAKDRVARDVHGQLFDVTDDNPLCVHDYSVPAAEEMLALHLLLQLPEHEDRMRQLT